MTPRSLLVGLLVVLALVPSGVGVVAAQEGEPTATATPTPAANESTVAARVDEDVYVEEFWYNASAQEFHLVLVNDGERDSTVTITESISRKDAGERRFGIEVVDVDVGATVSTSVSAKRVKGAAAVMVLTEKAIDSGTGLYLQESDTTDTRLIKGGADGAHVRAGGLGGVGAAVTITVLGAWQYVASRNDDVVDAELEPDTTFFGRFKK